MPLWKRLGQLLCLLGLALLLASCDRSGAERSAGGASVLLITLDTTRADRLGCYGYAGAQTPALDALAESGTRFEQAFCQVPLTLPSHVSLLTSTYPPTNGIRMNGRHLLSSELPTLAESFRAHNYRTGAFVGAQVLNSAFGLDRGFDLYEDRIGSDGDSPLVHGERPANEVCDAALAWLNQQLAAPFFAWVHFFDPHHPYAPPPDFRQKLADPYDGEIALTDSQVLRLVEWLEAHNRRRDTLVVVLGDHGEAFDEHDEVQHGLFLYDTTMRVPLIFSFPGRLPAGKVVSAGVRLVDVAPTILDLMGWEALPGQQGASLRPALEADTFAFLPMYGETEYPRVGFGWSPLRCYTTERWKYIVAPHSELYHRAADPEERRNLIAEHPQVAAQLQDELDDLLAGMEKRKPETATLDEDELRALRSLGYFGDVEVAPAQTDQPRRDPKDMTRVFRGLTEAQRLVRAHRYAEVVTLLEPLRAQSPESDELRAVLGEAYFRLGRFAEAEQEFRASLRTVPTNPVKLCSLGDALFRQDRTAEAMECYQRAASPPNDHGPAHNRLGVIYMQRNQLRQAEEHFRRHAEIDPASPNVLTNLASVLFRQGQHKEALELVREALKYKATFAPAHQLLWQLLVATQRWTEAVDALRTTCAALPEDVALKRHLAELLATGPQLGADAVQEAVALARRCCEAEPDTSENFDVLARAHAAAGDFPKAIEAARRAVALARDQGNSPLADQIAARLEAYRSGRIP